jgi:hypothetical protein
MGIAHRMLLYLVVVYYIIGRTHVTFPVEPAITFWTPSVGIARQIFGFKITTRVKIGVCLCFAQLPEDLKIAKINTKLEPTVL